MLSKIIRKTLENLSIFFSNNLNNLKFDDDNIYEIINKKIDINEKNLGNLKKTHVTFNNSLYKLIREKKLKKFLRYAFIQKMFFVHNRLFILKELNELKKNKKWFYYKKLLLEDDVGDPVRYFLYPSSSGNKINHVYHLSCLENTLNIELQKIKNIFEFGGGYGCMARIFSNINNKISYKIFDTYIVNCLQYYYLKQNGLDVGFENNKFDLINNFEKINDKVDFKNSLFIANWSLSEVPLDLRDNFVSLIGRYENIMISFQENFENINNLKYFKNLQENLKYKYNIKIILNKFYKGNILKPEKHYFLFGKKL
tara:strand:+ start:3317 stop:4252 length:936 start_codon:yes stop_codon:yes gene_type:complete